MPNTPAQPPLDQLCKLLLTGDHAAIVVRHSKPLTDALGLCQIFSLEENWDVVLLGILQYVEKNGKCPDAKSVYQFVTMSRDVRFEQAHHLIIDLDKELEDVEPLADDPAVLIERVIDDINMLALKKILQNALDIGRGKVKPAQCLAMKNPAGLKDSFEYISRGYAKLVDTGDSLNNGMWHENTAAIVETLNEKAKGAVVETLIRSMDDNWMLKLGKTLLIAGTSGDGKTTLMLTLLYNFALQGHNVVLFTLEDPQVDVWVKLAFIHTARFKDEFDLPSLFEWEQRTAWEAANKNQSQWLTSEEQANMRDVIASIKARDKVPGLIDVQPINEWSKMKVYTQSNMGENKYSIMAVDYFGERMMTPGSDPRWRDKELNAAAGEAITFAQENNLLLVAPVQVKKNLRDAYAAEYVDDVTQNSGFVAPYGDIAAVKADQIQSLPQGADYCIGVWSGDELKKKNQGLICCMKFRPTVQFPTFRIEAASRAASTYEMRAERGRSSWFPSRSARATAATSAR